MNLFNLFQKEENLQLEKKTLVILRWIAIVGQFFTISLVYFFLGFESIEDDLDKFSLSYFLILNNFFINSICCAVITF